LKKVVVAAVLAGAAFFAYRFYERLAVIHCYENFADAWAREAREEALRLTEGEAARQAVEKRGIRSLIDAWGVERIHGTSYSEESTERGNDGAIAVKARQTIAFDPPGITSALGGAMWMTFHHSARLRRTEDGWRVVDFVPTYVDMGRMRRP
jgi:hypothetical protein